MTPAVDAPTHTDVPLRAAERALLALAQEKAAALLDEAGRAILADAPPGAAIDLARGVVVVPLPPSPSED